MASEKDLMRGAPRRAGRRFTYVDYLSFPDDGQRYEILDGEVFVTAVPVPDHQRVSRCIMTPLMYWTRAHSPAEVFSAPIDLILADDTILQPDLLVSFDRATVTSRGVEAAPALVVEVLSPSTQDRDRGLKRERYARAGVPEYWVADPVLRSVEQYVLQDSGELQLLATHRGDDRIRCRSLPDFELRAATAFEDLDPA